MKKIYRRVREKLIKYIVHPLLISYVKRKKYRVGINTDELREKKVIVSLTSFPDRYKTLVLCLKSILLQKYKPDKIIVWLDKNAMSKVTYDMKFIEKYGVEYRLADEDIKSHKKYYYAMQEYANDLIITVDDDLIYSPYMIGSLIKMHKKYPNCICARRVHKINFDSIGKISKYYAWEKEFTEIKKPSHSLIATTGAGTLFFPNCLNKKAFDIDTIKQYCLSADDIWIKFMAYLNDIPVVWVPCKIILPPLIKDSQKNALYKSNVNREINDICINNVIEKFEINCDSLMK